MTYSMVIVRNDASTVTGQADDHMSAMAELNRWVRDPFYLPPHKARHSHFFIGCENNLYEYSLDDVLSWKEGGGLP